MADQIERMWCMLAIEPDGSEGICSTQNGGQHFPLVTGLERLVPAMIKMAERIAKASGREIIVAEFSTRTEVQRFGRAD